MAVAGIVEKVESKGNPLLPRGLAGNTQAMTWLDAESPALKLVESLTKVVGIFLAAGVALVGAIVYRRNRGSRKQ